MSENGEQRESEGTDKAPKWVWVSTEESFERGTISVLACAEVAAGIWLYWWLIPWWFETNLHLLISVLVAPLLLLRSPASVEAALAAFEQYLLGDEGVPRRSIRGAVAVLLAAGLSALASWGLAESWLSGHDGWSLFWRAGIIGWFSLQIGTASAVTVVGFRALTRTGTAKLAFASALALALIVAVTAVGAAAGVVAAVGVVAGAGVVVVAVAGGRTAAGALARAREIFTATVAWLLGIWIRSIIVKVGSTLRHLVEGWGQLSVNWRSLVWAHDLRRPPELLPGIERHPNMSYLGLSKMLGRYNFGSIAEHVLWAFVGALSLPVFFLPAWLYRLSLKSTCWFWWPLVFSQTSGRAAARAVAEGGIPGAEVVFEEHSKPWLAKLLFGLSSIFLVAAIGVPERLLTLLPVSGGGVDLLGEFGDKILLMLPCAGVQVALFLLCDRFLARAKAGHLGSRPRTAFRSLVSLRQFLLWSALLVALALFLENWVPVLTPFAELVESHYFSRFPLLKWT